MLKIENLPFVAHTPAHDDAQPYQVWLQKFQQFRGKCLDKHSFNEILNACFDFLNVCCDFESEHDTPIFSQGL